ncbi:MAG: hypothetical protein HUU37_07690, partial [Bdellovibrionales bacterium]|nr:hypothetical protein [Bdellovibrionales bacterium]
MGKRIFWVFVLLVGISSGLVVGYIQSERFAEILKTQIKRQFPEGSGLHLDFDRITVGILPPSASVVNLRLVAERAGNAAGLGKGSQVTAERLGITFKMIQAFSRGITINKVFIQGGNISLSIPPGSGGGSVDPLDVLFSPIRVSLDPSLHFFVRQIELRDSRLSLSLERRAGAPIRVDLEKMGLLSLAPERGGFSAVAQLEGLTYSDGSVRERLEALKGNVEADPAGLRISSLDVQRKQEAAHVEGQLLGNIREFGNLKMDLKAIVRGSASDLAEFVGSTGDLSGDILGDVRVRGAVKNPS